MPGFKVVRLNRAKGRDLTFAQKLALAEERARAMPERAEVRKAERERRRRLAIRATQRLFEGKAPSKPFGFRRRMLMEKWDRLADKLVVSMHLSLDPIMGKGRLLAALRRMRADGKMPAEHPAYSFLSELGEHRRAEERWVRLSQRPGAPALRKEDHGGDT